MELVVETKQESSEAEQQENANSAMSSEMKKAVNEDLFLIMSIMNKFISDEQE